MGARAMIKWDGNNGADTCVRASLYFISKRLQKQFTPEDDIQWDFFLNECNLRSWFGHRKSSEYTWSRTTDFLNIRRHLQKIIPWTMYAGLNADQLRPYYLNLAYTKDLLGALKVLFGFVYRAVPLFTTLSFFLPLWASIPISLFFSPYPSLMEFAGLKPHAFYALAKVHPIFFPFHALKPLWKISMKRNLKQPVSESTSNKITLLQQMTMAGIPVTYYYAKSVYETYFPEYFRDQTLNTETFWIGQELIKSTQMKKAP